MAPPGAPVRVTLNNIKRAAAQVVYASGRQHPLGHSLASSPNFLGGYPQSQPATQLPLAPQSLKGGGVLPSLILMQAQQFATSVAQSVANNTNAATGLTEAQIEEAYNKAQEQGQLSVFFTEIFDVLKKRFLPQGEQQKPNFAQNILEMFCDKFKILDQDLNINIKSIPYAVAKTELIAKACGLAAWVACVVALREEDGQKNSNDEIVSQLNEFAENLADDALLNHTNLLDKPLTAHDEASKKAEDDIKLIRKISRYIKTLKNILEKPGLVGKGATFLFYVQEELLRNLLGAPVGSVSKEIDQSVKGTLENPQQIIAELNNIQTEESHNLSDEDRDILKEVINELKEKINSQLGTSPKSPRRPSGPK